MAWRTWALLKERFKTLELIHCQNKIPKGGKPKPRGGECSPRPPLKETLIPIPLLNRVDSPTRLFNWVGVSTRLSNGTTTLHIAGCATDRILVYQLPINS